MASASSGQQGRTVMAAISSEHEGEARVALHAIVSDPVYGPDALSSVKTLSNLLQDFLPDAPRETGLLIAAASAGLPDKLRQHIDQGLDHATAIRLVSGYLANRTAFTEAACTWVATEVANALRFPDPDEVAAPRQPQIPTEVVSLPLGTAPAPGDSTQRQPAANATPAADPAVAAELAECTRWRSGQAEQGIQLPLGISTRRCCECASASSGPNTPIRSARAATSHRGPERPGIRLPPATYTPSCFPSASVSSAPSILPPSARATT
jgi:hypothetical protein